jgi:ubiquinone/menaquinone biosynthesis C-methylase UbiE
VYDVLVRLTTREATVKQALIDAACATAPRTVVDIGCGTGTLAVGVKRRWPQTQVIGVDLDDQMLGYARAKAVDADLNVEFIKADATNLPLPDGRADRVVASLFFHHLLPPQKRQALAEALRVLAQGGELYVADWGRPGNWLMRALFFPVRLLDGFANTADHVRGRLPALIREAGAEHVEPIAELSTLFGTLTLLRAIKTSR